MSLRMEKPVNIIWLVRALNGKVQMGAFCVVNQ